ncbi:hypothetical protein GGI23_000615 [Coemansia sp. RSA 2559]|nr:hypothetical protein GGI23_000615 [Coemansia sp. RSA 2559]
MAFDIIGILGFGKSFNILATGDTKIIDGVLKLAKLASLKSRVPFNEQLGRLVRDWVDGRNYVLAVIRDTIVKRKQDNAETACTEEKSGTEHMDLLQKLVNARDPFSGEPIDDESLIAEVSVLLVGGTDTTSNTLTWAMLCLLNRPDVYERLKTEVRMAFPDKRTVIRSDDAKSKLPYLTAVLYEVMRLHPAVGGYLPRAVPKEGAHLVNGEYFIPHGTEICVSLFACHRNKDTWNNPTEFDPDRFMGPDSEARMKDVLVFSSGVRICAGRHLAIVELYTALANLILRYDFKLPDGKEPCRHSVAEIQGSAYFNYSPNNTDKECWMIVSHAK